MGIFCKFSSDAVHCAAPGSGRNHSQTSTQDMLTSENQRTQTGTGAQQTTTAPRAMAALALHFARRLTRPPAAQSRSMGPNNRWRHSQRCMRSELRAAAQPAINMKTVVGRPGMKMPAMPSARLMPAQACSSQRSGRDGSMRSGGTLVAGRGAGCSISGMAYCAVGARARRRRAMLVRIGKDFL